MHSPMSPSNTRFRHDGIVMDMDMDMVMAIIMVTVTVTVTAIHQDQS